MQLKTPKRVQYIRMILCELNRISSHLYFISNMARIVDSEIILNQTLIARETVLRIIEFITGSRIHPNFIRIGGVRKNLNDEKTNAIKDIIPQIQDSVTRIESNVFNNMVINAKLKNTGNASIEQALNLGVTGPNLRACGARYDLRKNRNFLLYKDASFIISTGKYGDCLERTCMRFREIYQSIKIISQVIDDIPDERIKKLINLSDLEIPFTEMISTVECPHGAFKVFFEIKDNIILNLIIMGPSRNSLFLAEKILPGNRVEDIELILSSLDISSGEIIMEHAI